jgi:pimeloyl-ACP methyl ester carboxylesterase
MGGALAVWLAARHPDLVRALVLVNPAVFDRGRTRAQWTLRARFGPVHLPRADTLLVARARRLGPTRLVDSTLAWCVARPDRIDPEVRRRLIARAAERRADAAAGTAYVEAARSLYRYLRRDMTADEARVTCPVLVVHGRLDRLVPVDAARSLAARRPAFELVELSDVGHAPQLEAPETFLDVTLPWVRAALRAGRTPPAGAARQATTVTPSSASSARFITSPPP